MAAPKERAAFSWESREPSAGAEGARLGGGERLGSASDAAKGSVGTEPWLPAALGQLQSSSSGPGAVLGSLGLAKGLGSSHGEGSLPWCW